MIINEAKIYDREYVEKVLGIKIPLQETIFGYSSEFHARVLKEHMLYEGFIDTLKQAAGLVVNAAGQAAGAAGQAVTNAVQAGVQKATNTVDKVKNLASSLYAIMKDSGSLNGYLAVIKRDLGKLLMPFRDLLNKIEEFLREDSAVVKYVIDKFPTYKNQIEEYRKTYTSIKNWIKTNILDPITNLAGWGGALLGSTIYVIIQYLKENYNIFDMIKQLLGGWVAGTNVAQEAIEKYMGVLKKFQTMFWDKIKNTSIGGIIATAKAGFDAFNPWLNSLGTLIGGTIKVADILSPITTKFIGRSSQEYQQWYSQENEKAAAQLAADQAAGRLSLARGPKQAPIQQSGYRSQFMTNVPGAARPPTPAPAPVREHSNIGLLLQYLNE